ncbi:MAG: CBS domain-containing protein [Oscillospiraceae bacterium]|nr:CBS domain-containing protein [Oscillospiraceae bacterium]
MLVKNRMTLNPYTVTPETSINEAYSLMKDHSVSRLPVMKGGKLVGLVTKSGIERVTPSSATALSVFELNYLLNKMTVKDAMIAEPPTIADNDLVENAAVLMRDKNITALPVLRDGRLVGIITEKDIFDAFIEMLGVRNSGARLVVRMPNEPGAAADVITIISKYEINIQHMALNNGREGAEIIFRLDTDDASDIKRAIAAKGYEIVAEESN